MASRSQLDLVISSLVLIRKASSAIDAALGLPAADRAQLEESLDAVRTDLNQVIKQLGGSIPGASALGRRPEVKMAAGIVDFVARQGAVQLGAVAGLADAVRQGGDSRSLAQRIERHVAAEGVASRDDLAGALGIEPDAARLQEAIERALSSGRAEWYGPGLYGIPREQLEELVSEEAEETEAEVEGGEAGEARGPGALGAAVESLESSLGALGTALTDAPTSEPAVPERIRELRRLADDGVISEDEFELKKREILERM